MSETVWYTFSTEGEPLHPTMPEDHEPWYKGEVVIKGAVPPPTGNEQRWIVTVYGKSGNATKWDGVPVPFHAVDPAYAQFMGEVQAADRAQAIARAHELALAYADEILQMSRISRGDDRIWRDITPDTTWMEEGA